MAGCLQKLFWWCHPASIPSLGSNGRAVGRFLGLSTTGGELWTATLETRFPSELLWGEESCNRSLDTADACWGRQHCSSALSPRQESIARFDIGGHGLKVAADNPACPWERQSTAVYSQAPGLQISLGGHSKLCPSGFFSVFDSLKGLTSCSKHHKWISTLVPTVHSRCVSAQSQTLALDNWGFLCAFCKMSYSSFPALSCMRLLCAVKYSCCSIPPQKHPVHLPQPSTGRWLERWML